MEVDGRLFMAGFVITLIIFGAVIFSNSLMNSQREDTVAIKMDTIVKDYEDMQTVLWMSELLGQESGCIALESMITKMNTGLWDLGKKIDEYRKVTEEFAKDPFYIAQKREFNRQEVLYFSTLQSMNEKCNINQTIISYFYKKKEECPDCDAQSFVLQDIKRDLETQNMENELAIFSFDTDLDLVTIDLLTKFYNVTSYPCIVIENISYCGLYDKNTLTSILCEHTNLSICG
jgi:hypothetical protein